MLFYVDIHIHNILNCLNHFVLKHCVKSFSIRTVSDPYFLAFWLNTERYGISLCIQSKWGKTRTRKIPNMTTFHLALVSFYTTEKDQKTYSFLNKDINKFAKDLKITKICYKKSCWNILIQQKLLTLRKRHVISIYYEVFF